jgi:hypothetical protein
VQTFQDSMKGGFPDSHAVPQEPPLAPYTRPGHVEGAQLTAPAGSSNPSSRPAHGGVAAAGRTLPATGGRPRLAAAVLVAVLGLAFRRVAHAKRVA